MFSTTQKNHQLYKFYYNQVISWEDAISNIDYCILNNRILRKYENFGFLSYDAHLIKKCDYIFNKIEEQNKNTRFNITTAHLYISLSKNSKTSGKHRDGAFVWYWQCIGKTQWIIYENEKEFTYELSPGDIIYVPRGVYHSVFPLTPRAGISFGAEIRSDDNCEDIIKEKTVI